ncbi:hypothetical protein AMTR_s00039p00144170 [Amborella trichopoda]|uniref:Uncharacterized protein n=1 Tax=Amborella trichopoda TaxID=13333 RepID=U5CRG3_AMBTC|nr:hypothetical protein AMTR_s00039p00144170 [Amborella trichopoda]
MSMINHRRPDNTFSENTDLFDILMEVCASMNAIQEAKQTHVHAIITGFDQYAFLQAKVIAMYDRLGLLIDSRMAFNSIRNPKILSWNAIIRAYVCHGNFNEAMRMYHLMAANGVCGDGFTFPLIIRSCSATGSVEECRKVHDDLVQVGLELRLHVANGLIGMYSRLGRMDIAASIFERMPLRDVISWNILMSGYVSNLDCGRALALFERMVSGKLKPNSITWTSLISAHSRCAHYDQALCLFVKMRTLGALLNGEIVAVVLSVCSRLSALNKGKEIHGYVIRGGFEHLMCVNNSLVDMYGTCGVMDDAKAIFQEMGEKDLVTWNAMISCYALVGYCHKAFELFSQLEIEKKKELRPNVVTWSSVINGFASKGNGEKALELFRQMQMAGIEPNSVTMATMLSVLADLAALDHGKEIHGLKKEAGQSWIEVKKKVYMFKAGFDSQPGLDEVYAILEDLTQKMGAVGYVPDNTPVVDKEEKEINSLWP